MSRTLLRVTGIAKRFPGVQALDDVSLEVAAGEVHGLLGENGAGKIDAAEDPRGRARRPMPAAIEFEGRP